MKTLSRFTLFTSILFFGAHSAYTQSFSVLHSFTGTDGDGPRGRLALSGSTLYGAATSGGSTNSGTIFSMSADGSAFQTLHNFTGFSGGYRPFSGLTLNGAKLFGSTFGGGTSNVGSLFSIGTDGTGFEVFYSFAGNSDGSSPLSPLISSGTRLYGTASGSGNNGKGTIFSINPTSSSFSVLHAFASNGSEGSDSRAALTLANGKLFGVTNQGGANGLGDIFSLNLDGTGFSKFYDFSGSSNLLPNALTISGSTIYGTTYAGGASNSGFVFSLDTSGSGFQILHTFSGSDGANPTAGLTLSGATLFGTTSSGVGSTANGTIFSLSTDGSAFNVLHSYGGTQTNGARPSNDLLLSGGTLYGLTSSGGSSSAGTLFAQTVPEPTTASLILFGATFCLRRRPLRTHERNA